MVSSFQVSQEAQDKFNALRMSRASRYLIFRITEDKSTLILEKEGERSAPFSEFAAAMNLKEPRFAVYDLEFKTDDGRAESKVVFILYSPDDATNSSDRFMYAQNKEAVKQKISPVHKEMQINDYHDINEQEWIGEF